MLPLIAALGIPLTVVGLAILGRKKKEAKTPEDRQNYKKMYEALKKHLDEMEKKVEALERQLVQANKNNSIVLNNPVFIIGRPSTPAPRFKKNAQSFAIN